MALKIDSFDVPNKRVIFDLDAGNVTTRTVQQIGSLIKQKLKSPAWSWLDQMFEWSGGDALSGGNKVGIVFKWLDDWELWTVDAGSLHLFQVTEGIILPTTIGNRPYGTPVNVNFAVPEYTVSSILGATDVDKLATAIADILLIKQFHAIGGNKKFSTVDNKVHITDETKVTEVIVQQTDDRDNATSVEDIT